MYRAQPSASDASRMPGNGERKDSGLSDRPSIDIPKGGGAIRGIGEKFAANPVTGTGSITFPIATSPGRSGFGPQLSLSYDSGAGNGPFGFGWSVSLPQISRKTDKGLPQYRNGEESDVFILSGVEDLVPVFRTKPNGEWEFDADGRHVIDDQERGGYLVRRYRPRVEGLFARIERWTEVATGDVHWRSMSRDNVTTVYGKDNDSRIFDPEETSSTHPTRVFAWLICQSYDDKGNAIVYEYARENDGNIDFGQANERNRARTANRYLKRIKYGNRAPNRNENTWQAIDPAQLSDDTWMFEVVFDYDEDHYEMVEPDPNLTLAEQHSLVIAAPSAGAVWAARPDPFSSYRACFEVRTYRRCHRVLMFHHISDLPGGGKGYDGLVQSTEFDYADIAYAQPIAIEEEILHQGSTRFGSFLRAVTQSGHVRDDSKPSILQNGVLYTTYLRKSLPPLEFEYSKAAIQDEVRDLDAASLENRPGSMVRITSGSIWTAKASQGFLRNRRMPGSTSRTSEAAASVHCSGLPATLPLLP